MSTVAIASTNPASPTTVFTSSARILHVKNPDAAITIHATDPFCCSPGKYVDLAPGEDHYFVRPGSVKGTISAYSDTGTPNIVINEVGGRGA